MSIRVKTPSTDNILTLQFLWVTWATIETLKTMAQSSSTYTLKPENNVATTYSVRFSAKGVSDIKHAAFGTDVYPGGVVNEKTDLWNGTLNLIKVA